MDTRLWGGPLSILKDEYHEVHANTPRPAHRTSTSDSSSSDEEEFARWIERKTASTGQNRKKKSADTEAVSKSAATWDRRTPRHGAHDRTNAISPGTVQDLRSQFSSAVNSPGKRHLSVQTSFGLPEPYAPSLSQLTDEMHWAESPTSPLAGHLKKLEENLREFTLRVQTNFDSGSSAPVSSDADSELLDSPVMSADSPTDSGRELVSSYAASPQSVLLRNKDENPLGDTVGTPAVRSSETLGKTKQSIALAADQDVQLDTVGSLSVLSNAPQTDAHQLSSSSATLTVSTSVEQCNIATISSEPILPKNLPPIKTKRPAHLAKRRVHTPKGTSRLRVSSSQLETDSETPPTPGSIPPPSPYANDTLSTPPSPLDTTTSQATPLSASPHTPTASQLPHDPVDHLLANHGVSQAEQQLMEKHADSGRAAHGRLGLRMRRRLTVVSVPPRHATLQLQTAPWRSMFQWLAQNMPLANNIISTFVVLLVALLLLQKTGGPFSQQALHNLSSFVQPKHLPTGFSSERAAEYAKHLGYQAATVWESTHAHVTRSISKTIMGCNSLLRRTSWEVRSSIRRFNTWLHNFVDEVSYIEDASGEKIHVYYLYCASVHEGLEDLWDLVSGCMFSLRRGLRWALSPFHISVEWLADEVHQAWTGSVLLLARGALHVVDLFAKRPVVHVVCGVLRSEQAIESCKTHGRAAHSSVVYYLSKLAIDATDGASPTEDKAQDPACLNHEAAVRHVGSCPTHSHLQEQQASYDVASGKDAGHAWQGSTLHPFVQQEMENLLQRMKDSSNQQVGVPDEAQRDGSTPSGNEMLADRQVEQLLADVLSDMPDDKGNVQDQIHDVSEHNSPQWTVLHHGEDSTTTIVDVLPDVSQNSETWNVDDQNDGAAVVRMLEEHAKDNRSAAPSPTLSPEMLGVFPDLSDLLEPAEDDEQQHNKHGVEQDASALHDTIRSRAGGKWGGHNNSLMSRQVIFNVLQMCSMLKEVTVWSTWGVAGLVAAVAFAIGAVMVAAYSAAAAGQTAAAASEVPVQAPRSVALETDNQSAPVHVQAAVPTAGGQNAAAALSAGGATCRYSLRSRATHSVASQDYNSSPMPTHRSRPATPTASGVTASQVSRGQSEVTSQRQGANHGTPYSFRSRQRPSGRRTPHPADPVHDEEGEQQAVAHGAQADAHGGAEGAYGDFNWLRPNVASPRHEALHPVDYRWLRKRTYIVPNEAQVEAATHSTELQGLLRQLTPRSPMYNLRAAASAHAHGAASPQHAAQHPPAAASPAQRTTRSTARVTRSAQ